MSTDQSRERRMDRPTNNRPARDSDRPLKNMPCPYEGCGQYFRCQHNVDQHIREKHTGVRPFKCHICVAAGAKRDSGKPIGEFARLGPLNRHYLRVHKMDTKFRISKRRAPTKKIVGVNAVEASMAEPAAKMLTKKMQPGPGSPYVAICEYVHCREGFLTEDDELVHYHIEHDHPEDMSCPCSICRQHFAGLQQEAIPQSPQPVPQDVAQYQAQHQPAAYAPVFQDINQPQQAQQSAPLFDTIDFDEALLRQRLRGSWLHTDESSTDPALPH